MRFQRESFKKKSDKRAVTLADICPGEEGVVCALRSEGSMRRRLLDIGLVENTRVECVGRSPGGDPLAFLIRGAVIAIRRADCGDILLAEKEGNAGCKR